MSEVRRRQYTKEFKKEAVELVTGENYTVTQAASSLGISRNMLDRCCREYRDRGEAAFLSMGHQGTSRVNRRIRRLKKNSNTNSGNAPFMLGMMRKRYHRLNTW